MDKLAFKAFIAKAMARGAFKAVKPVFRGIARLGRSAARSYKRGLRGDNRNFGRFTSSPKHFVKETWKSTGTGTKGVISKAFVFGIPAAELAQGKPASAAGWLVAPTTMATVEAAGAAKSGIKALNKRRKKNKPPTSMQSGGKYFG